MVQPTVVKWTTFYAKWHRARINIPQDILENNLNILSMPEIENLFGLKCNFLEYFRVWKCLQETISSSSITHVDHNWPILPPYLQILLSNKNGSNYFYNILSNLYSNYNWKISKMKYVYLKSLWAMICFYTIKQNNLVWL